MVTTHLARFELERMAAEDPDAKLGAARRVHVGGCDLCQTRLRALLAACRVVLLGMAALLSVHGKNGAARTCEAERATRRETLSVTRQSTYPVAS